MDFLPEISESQAKFSAIHTGSAALFPEQAIYLTSMFGFILFYGFEYMVAESAGDEPGRGFFSLRIAAFAGYSSLIAYLSGPQHLEQCSIPITLFPGNGVSLAPCGPLAC